MALSCSCTVATGWQDYSYCIPKAGLCAPPPSPVNMLVPGGLGAKALPGYGMKAEAGLLYWLAWKVGTVDAYCPR